MSSRTLSQGQAATSGRFRIFGSVFATLGAAVVTALVLVSAAAASTICNNFGGTICCGSQSWGSFSHTSIASWYGTPGLHYYARRRTDQFVLTYNEYVYNGGSLFKDFQTPDYLRGTGLYRSGAAIVDYAVSDATNSSC
jgi:hypothetical protein